MHRSSSAARNVFSCQTSCGSNLKTHVGFQEQQSTLKTVKMLETEDTFAENSDLEDDSKHNQLIDNVISLSKPLRIKKPSRTEPTVKVSEYDLVRSIAGNKGTVHVHELAGLLKHKSKLVELSKKVKKLEKKAKTLPKPLEKPQAERIKRAVGYEKSRQELDKWEPVITSNRASVNLTFPLDTTVNFGKEDKSRFDYRVKSELQKKLEAIENKYEVHVVETEEEKKIPLTLEEILEMRSNAAKMRAQQSYKEARARRQNKIKSKKFHRIQRREKMKQQLKEFELLQKTDPEAALKKLEEIEKARAEERFNLRHKSTGQWARNKQIRAKYDKESRQVLAQQLAISRDLTKKLQVDNSESEDEERENSAENQQEKPVNNPIDPNNPWIKTDAEIDNFIHSYRKFWDEQNKQKEMARNAVTDDKTTKDTEDGVVEVKEDNLEETQEVEESKPVPKIQKKTKKKKEEKPLKRKLEETPKENKKRKSTEWQITSIDDDTAIENLFDDLEKKVENTLQKKSKKILKNTAVNNKVSNKKTQKEKKEKKTKKVDLTIPKPITRPVIDEELLQTPGNYAESTSEQPNKNLEMLQNILKATREPKQKAKSVASENIDPNKAINVKPISLNTEIPELLTVEENDSDDNDNENIAGIAFEDDDVVDEFNKEKAEAVEKGKPKDINLTLPGWGAWGGKNLQVPKKKRKKFIIKFPKQTKRKDMNKGKVIINEDGYEKARQHQVSEVPFPFKTVKDFEASIRAPIGSTFVPEVPHRKMTRPPVRTKMGTIIEPMSEEILLKKALKGLPIVK